MWRACPAMPGCSWVRWTSPTWTISTACLRPSPSTRRPPARTPGSTVGTVTEIYDYLRLLWAGGHPPLPQVRQGDPPADHRPDHRPDHGFCRRAPASRCWPWWSGPQGRARQGAGRRPAFRLCPGPVDGNLYDLSEDIPLEKNKKHNIEIVVDRLIVRPDGAAADGLRGDRLPPVRRHRRGEPGAGGAGPDLFPELRLRRLRHQHRGADAPDVLLQQPLRPVPPARAWGCS